MGVVRLSLVIMFCKIVLSTSRRGVYPFATEAARKADLSLATIAAAIAAMQVVYMISPSLAPVCLHRFGIRATFVGCIMFHAAVLAAIAAFPAAIAFTIPLLGVAKGFFDPTWQATIGGAVPAEDRGRVVATVEFSWGIASTVGLPLLGLGLVWSWAGAFSVLASWAVLGAGMLVCLHIPGAAGPSDAKGVSWGDWADVARSPRAVAVVATCLVACASYDCIFLSFAPWLEQTAGYDLPAVAKATFMIGVADVTAELVVWLAFTLFHISVPGFIAAAQLFNAVAYALVAVFGESAEGWAGFSALFSAFMCFEVLIVGMMSSLSEQTGTFRRGVMESAGFAAMGLGRAAGVSLQPTLYSVGGMQAASCFGAVASTLCLAGLLRTHPRRSEPEEEPLLAVAQ